MTRDTSDLDRDHRLRSTFRREGEYWTIAFAGATCRLRDSAGLRQVAYLLARPGERVTAIELVVAGVGAQEADDAWRANLPMSRYARPDAVERHGSAGASPSSGDGDRSAGSTDALAQERARVRVTHAIRHTLRRIEAHHAELNEHLRATIKTGSSCAYLPDPRRTIRWEL